MPVGARIIYLLSTRRVQLYCKLFFFCFCFIIFDVIFSITKGVQHDGRLPFWKPASVFTHYVRIVIVFAIGEINILLLPTA